MKMFVKSTLVCALTLSLLQHTAAAQSTVPVKNTLSHFFDDIKTRGLDLLKNSLTDLEVFARNARNTLDQTSTMTRSINLSGSSWALLPSMHGLQNAHLKKNALTTHALHLKNKTPFVFTDLITLITGILDQSTPETGWAELITQCNDDQITELLLGLLGTENNDSFLFVVPDATGSVLYRLDNAGMTRLSGAGNTIGNLPFLYVRALEHQKALVAGQDREKNIFLWALDTQTGAATAVTLPTMTTWSDIRLSSAPHQRGYIQLKNAQTNSWTLWNYQTTLRPVTGLPIDIQSLSLISVHNTCFALITNDTQTSIYHLDTLANTGLLITGLPDAMFNPRILTINASYYLTYLNDNGALHTNYIHETNTQAVTGLPDNITNINVFTHASQHYIVYENEQGWSLASLTMTSPTDWIIDAPLLANYHTLDAHTGPSGCLITGSINDEWFLWHLTSKALKGLVGLPRKALLDNDGVKSIEIENDGHHHLVFLKKDGNDPSILLKWKGSSFDVFSGTETYPDVFNPVALIKSPLSPGRCFLLSQKIGLPESTSFSAWTFYNNNLTLLWHFGFSSESFPALCASGMVTPEDLGSIVANVISSGYLPLETISATTFPLWHALSRKIDVNTQTLLNILCPSIETILAALLQNNTLELERFLPSFIDGMINNGQEESLIIILSELFIGKKRITRDALMPMLKSIESAPRTRIINYLLETKSEQIIHRNDRQSRQETNPDCPLLCVSFNPQGSCAPGCFTSSSPSCQKTVHLGIVPCADRDNGDAFYSDFCKKDGDKQSQLSIAPGTLCFEISSRNIRDASPLPRVWKSSAGGDADLIESLTQLQPQLGQTMFDNVLPSLLSCLSQEDAEKLNAVQVTNLCAPGYYLANDPACTETCAPSCASPLLADPTSFGTCSQLIGCCPFDPQTETLSFMFDQACAYSDGAFVNLEFTSTVCTIVDGSASYSCLPITFTACIWVHPNMTLEQFEQVNDQNSCY